MSTAGAFPRPYRRSPDQDHGTPARESQTKVTVQVDGTEVTVPAGTSILRHIADDCAAFASAGTEANIASGWNDPGDGLQQ